MYDRLVMLFGFALGIVVIIYPLVTPADKAIIQGGPEETVSPLSADFKNPTYGQLRGDQFMADFHDQTPTPTPRNIPNRVTGEIGGVTIILPSPTSVHSPSSIPSLFPDPTPHPELINNTDEALLSTEAFPSSNPSSNTNHDMWDTDPPLLN